METSTDLAAPVRLTPAAKLAIVCLVYAGIAAWLSPTSFLAAFGETRLRIYYLLIPPTIFFGLAIAGVIKRPQSPLGFIRDKIKSRGVGACLAIMLFIACLAAFTTYKHEFSESVSFFADPLFARMDAAIHFGDPWRWARAIPFPWYIDRLLFIFYSRLWLAQLAGVVVFAAWLDDAVARQRYFTALTTTAIVLGIGVRLAGSSAGPIFYDRLFGEVRFADLTKTMMQSNAGPDTMGIADYLWASYVSNETVIGSGISAMPSFHVAIVTLNALFLSSINRWVGMATWIYAAIILFGSVYSGWHYAIDGYASIALVLLIWRLAQRDLRVDIEG
ncbi:phosphatase PAP2 family protein [Mesorhizobium sp.]|uniref:phosphatase PAP2 family protein n=1 Tax=Mesorhizobium sp. TaxID=1871066 RepID=UPI000FE5FDC8|nr:phosphatase PAP2 family protein [Mesorhizobium sp.]RWF66833.1 MAG: hypothetical protein EOS47_04400 [Mesorhizobium sp.]